MAARSGDASAASSAGASPLNPSSRAGDSGDIPLGERGDMGILGSSSPGTSMRRFANPPMPLCESRPGESNDDFAGGEPTNSNSSSFLELAAASLRPGDPTQSPPPAGLSYSRLFGSEDAAGARGDEGKPRVGGK